MKKLILATILTTLFNPVNANMFVANEALRDEDYSLAKKELTKSAEIGNSEAQFKLGLMNVQGKGGGVDKIEAMAWFYLASQYEYPQAMDFAGQIYQGLPAAQQDKASAYADNLTKKYGKKVVKQTLYPLLTNEPVEAQVINQGSRLLRRGPLSYSGSNANAARNQAAINSAARNGQAALSGLVNHDSGVTYVLLTVGKDGKTRDEEILFSWPRERFDKASLDSAKKSKFKPARREGERVEENGIILPASFGISAASNLKDDYPHLHKQYRSLKKNSSDSLSANYQYACFLRGYENLLSDDEYEAFAPVLLSAAKKGHYLAQFDYAQYQIYQNDEAELGMPWLIKSAKSGLAKAEYKLGDILFHSPSPYIQQDLDKAEFWLEKAAKQNHLKAQQKLTQIRLSKEAIDEEFAEQAIEWLEEIEDENQATPDTYFLLAKAYLAIGDNSEAEDYIEEAIEEAEKLKWDTVEWKKFQSTLES